MFSAHTQPLRDRYLPEEDMRVLNKIIPDLQLDLEEVAVAKRLGVRGEHACASLWGAARAPPRVGSRPCGTTARWRS